VTPNGLAPNDIRAVLIAAVKKQGTAKAVATQLGISAQYLSDIITGHREVSDPVARKLGYRRVVTFEPIRKGDL
jgi:DNA-binding transcriptional regulator YdaS (Cro superfamily)